MLPSMTKHARYLAEMTPTFQHQIQHQEEMPWQLAM